MNSVLGINFGGTSTILTTIINGMPQVIEIGGKKKISTCVAYIPESGGFVIGDEAMAERLRRPENAIWNLPDLFFPAAEDTFYSLMKECGTIELNIDTISSTTVKFGENWYTLSTVITFFLSTIKEEAEKATGLTFDFAVVSISATSSLIRRKELVSAVLEAGFSKCRFKSEPELAVLGGAMNELQEERNSAVVFAGYSHSISAIVTQADGVFERDSTEPVTVSSGYAQADTSLAEYLATQLFAEKGIKIEPGTPGFVQLWTAAELARDSLDEQFSLTIDALIKPDASTISHTISLSADFIEEFYIRELAPLREYLLKISPSKPLNHLYVAQERQGSWMPALIGCAEHFSVKNKKTLPADELIVWGLGALCGLFSGVDYFKDMLVLDTLTQATGIMSGDDFYKISEPGLILPSKKHVTFTTSTDNQEAVSINVYEGYSDKVSDNTFVGIVDLEGIPPMPAGKAQVKISYSFDDYGSLTVLGEETETGTDLTITTRIK